MVTNEGATAGDFFNGAFKALREPDVARAVVCLRRGFFENLYIAPLILGEDCAKQDIWHPSPEAEPPAAREYLKRYGDLWLEDANVRLFLREVWNDTLVRAELRSYINLSKNLFNAASRRQRTELFNERSMFTNPKRLARTQAEILVRLEKVELRRTRPPPKLALVLLAAKDPATSLEFYKTLLQMDPTTTHQGAGGYVEFELEGVSLAIHGRVDAAADDPYRLGRPPESLGWGAIFVIQVQDISSYHENATNAGFDIVDCDLDTEGQRFFVVRDPSGYLLELTEDKPRGLVVGQR